MKDWYRVYRMLRPFVIGFNVLIVLGMVMVSSWLLLQMATNRIWEQTFYGEISLITQAFWGSGVLVLCIALLTSVATFGYVYRQRWGFHLLFILSLVFLWTLPSPLSWFSLICAVSIVLETAGEKTPPMDQSI